MFIVTDEMKEKSKKNCNTRDAIPRTSDTRSVPFKNISANDPFKTQMRGNNHKDLLPLVEHLIFSLIMINHESIYVCVCVGLIYNIQ